ncbi:MAG: biopolymer transporter ExbD [Pseudomonadota bacterium]
MTARSSLGALALLATASGALSACASGSDAEAAKPAWTINETTNVLAIASDNTILWNGEAASLEKLKGLLAETRAMDPEPQLRFEPAIEASYELSAGVLKIMKEAGVTKFGFVGNEKYPPPEQTPPQTQD